MASVAGASDPSSMPTEDQARSDRARRLDAAVTDLDVGVIVAVADTPGAVPDRLEVVNERASRFFRLPGRPDRDTGVVDGVAELGLWEHIAHTAETGERVTVRNLPAPGGTLLGRMLDVSLSRLDDRAVLVVAQDVSAERTAESRLRHVADHDELTGAASRRAMLTRLAEVDSGPGPVLLLVDLHRFREVNDALGYLAGDELLRIVARRLEEAAPRGSLVARLQADEFAVVAPCALAEADTVAGVLHDRVTRPAAIAGLRVGVGAAIGVAGRSMAEMRPSTVLRLADLALQEAKTSGRRHHVSASNDTSDAVEHLRLAGRLDEAFANGEFVVHRQPLVDLGTRAVLGHEMLVRWDEPELGLQLPARFLDLVALEGRLPQLTETVLARSLPLVEPGRIVSVNLSSQDLHLADLDEMVAEMLERFGVDPAQLWLEVLEGELGDVAADTVGRLRALGCRVALDDLGAGFSSFGRLGEIEVDAVKLDRRLVAPIARSPRAATLVRSLTSLVHDLGALVVAEGVEDEATLTELVTAGCDIAQGFALGRPAPAPGRS